MICTVYSCRTDTSVRAPSPCATQGYYYNSSIDSRRKMGQSILHSDAIPTETRLQVLHSDTIPTENKIIPSRHHHRRRGYRRGCRLLLLVGLPCLCRNAFAVVSTLPPPTSSSSILLTVQLSLTRALFHDTRESRTTLPLFYSSLC